MTDWEYCIEALREVSRTFSKPIELLDDRLRRPITCAYLLCRVADAVEDHPDLNDEGRVDLFRRFLDVLELDAPVEHFTAALAEYPAEGKDIDAALNLGCIMSVYRALDPEQQTACTPWVAELSRGMELYGRRRPVRGNFRQLLTLRDLERYCYFVAGTVGHLLTELFLLELPDLAPERRAVMEANAEDFGMGLQLVNILKDVTDDWERDWSFIPQTVALRAGVDPANMLAPENREAMLEALRPILDLARRSLDAAFEYTLSIPEDARDIRLFCLLPLWMAVRTLHLIEGNPDVLTRGRPVKITRDEVAELIQDCMNRHHDDAALREGYETLLKDPRPAASA